MRKSTFDLSRPRTSDDLESLYPNVKCHKCGASYWSRDSAPLTWGCVRCGNSVYLELGQPVQQIDVLMRSLRKGEFKKTDRGTIVPVTEWNWDEDQKRKGRRQ